MPQHNIGEPGVVPERQIYTNQVAYCRALPEREWRTDRSDSRLLAPAGVSNFAPQGNLHAPSQNQHKSHP
jgi:hypothetical protein